MVLGVPVGAKRRLALRVRRVGFVAFEVRAGGVEEQQVDLEVGVYREFVRKTGLSREGGRRVELAVGAVVA